MEDAVTFLENVSSQYPNVSALLSKTQLLALDMDPKEPFDDTNVSNDTVEFAFTSGFILCICYIFVYMMQVSEKFVRLVEGYFVTKHAIHTAKTALRMALLEPQNKGDAVDTQDQEIVISCLEKVSIHPVSRVTS